MKTIKETMTVKTAKTVTVTNAPKNTFAILFFLRRDRVKPNGNIPIFCRITIAGDSTTFNLYTEVNPKIWDIKFNRAKGRSDEAAEVNKTLDNISASVIAKYKELTDKFGNTTAERVKNELLGLATESENPMTLLNLFKQHNEDMEKLVGIDFSPAILQKYKCVYKKMQAFLKHKYKVSDIKLTDIKQQFILDFDAYMKIHDKLQQNSASRNLRLLKKIINLAKNNGYITADPYASYTIKFQKTDRGYLNEGELKTIMNKTFKIERLENVKDIFLFSCFTGLAYSDIVDLKYKDLQEGVDKYLWIMKKRVKTGTDITVPLMDYPLALVEKYRGKQADMKVLPNMSNQKLNAYLKEIADVCGITKNLTFHIARHSNLSFRLKTSNLQVKFPQQVTTWKRADFCLSPYFA